MTHEKYRSGKLIKLLKYQSQRYGKMIYYDRLYLRKGVERMTKRRYQNAKRAIEAWDDIFRALCADPRRQLLISLLDTDPGESVPLPESAANPTVPPDPEDLRMELRHLHLPKLVDNEFVVWEDDPFRAYHGPRFEEVGMVFNALFTHSDELPDRVVTGCHRLEEEREL